MCSASISLGGTRVLTGYSPVSEFSFLPRYHLFDSFASWHGLDRAKQMNEEAASLVRIEGIRSRTGAEKATHSLFLIQIFLGNIILRYLMSANFPLISAPSVFHARHYVSF